MLEKTYRKEEKREERVIFHRKGYKLKRGKGKKCTAFSKIYTYFDVATGSLCTGV